MKAQSHSKQRLYALYVRESTAKQLEGKAYDSLASQEDYLRSFVAQHGGEVFNVYSDTESGTKFHAREGLMELLADAQAGKFQAAVAYDMDRWARNVEIHFAVKKISREAGVDFISATQRFGDDPEGKLMELQIAGFAQFYSDTISKKVKIKRLLMAKEGRWRGGKVPFGYKSVDKMLVPHPEEAKIVQQMFALYLEHSSLAAVRHRLEAQGHKSRSGAPLSMSVLESVIKNRLYVGEIRENGEWYKGRHEAIVDPVLFEAVQGLTPTKRRLITKTDRPYPLVSLLRCSACGSGMTMSYVRKKNGTEVPYYRCTRTFKMDWNSCPLKQVNANWIEGEVEEMLKELSVSPELVSKAVASANSSSADQAAPLREKERGLLDRHRSIKAKLKNLVDIVAAQGASAFDSFRDAIAQGEKERAHVEAELALLREEIARLTTKLVDPDRAATVLRSFYLLFHLATPAEKRELLHLLLKKVEFQGKEKPITLELFDLRSLEYDGSKLRPVWLRGEDSNLGPGD